MDIFNREQWTESECQYYELVRKCSGSRQDTNLSNSKSSHAIFLINELIRTATSTVKIYSGQLLQKTPGEDPQKLFSNTYIIDAVNRFLLTDTPEIKRFDIVVETGVDGGWDRHPLVLSIQKLFKSRKLNATCSIRDLTEQGSKLLDEHGANNHFVVSDDSAFRLEIDSKQHKAIANFGDVKLASKLGRSFDLIHLKHSKELIRFSS